jgi:hypothetical protein
MMYPGTTALKLTRPTGSGKAGTLEIPLHIVAATATAAQQAAAKTE